MYVVCLVSEVKGFWGGQKLCVLSCLYNCHCYLGQGNATRRVLLLAGAGENWNLHDSWPRF